MTTNSQSPSVLTTDNKQIKTVSAPCGAGKTFSLGSHIKQNEAFKTKWLVAMPTKDMCNQASYDFKTIHNIDNVHNIHSNNTNNVSLSVQHTIKQINQQESGVIVITQAALLNIPFFQNKEEWNLVIDEIPSVDNFYEPTLPYNYTNLFSFIRVKQQITPDLLEIELKNEVSAKLFCNRNYDDVDNIIKPIIKDLIEHKQVFTDKPNWDKISKNDITDDGEVDMTYGNAKNKLYFLSMLKPKIYDGFKTVTIMGANFEQSLLFKWWSEYCNVDFQTHKKITSKLRYLEYTNGGRLHLWYGSEKKWSKRQRDKQYNDELTMGQYLEQKVNEKFGANTLYAVNKDQYDTTLKGNEIPVISFGLNKYDQYDNIYFGAALNRKPKHIKMLNSLGIDSDYISRAQAYEICHQAIMRTSLRRPDCNNDVNAILTDIFVAESIARLFPGCHIGPIDGVSKKVVGYKTNNNKKTSKIEKFRDLYELNFEKSLINEEGSENILNRIRSDLGYFEYPEEFNDFDVILNKFDNLNHSHKPSELTQYTALQFIDVMKQTYNNNNVEVKDNTWLFNGSIFGKLAEEYGTRRLQENMALSTFVVLDIDDGELTPEEFHRIFTEDYPHSHIMMNSFSRSELQPNRFRAIFFVKGFLTGDVYYDIQQYIAGIISKYGYQTVPKQHIEEMRLSDPNFKYSGIDWTKQKTSNIFYAPGKAIGREEWGFFWKSKTRNEAELNRYAIDPTKILRYQTEETKLDQLVFEQIEYKTDNVEETKHYNKVMRLINQMGPGNRSYNAQQIAGMIQNYPDHIKYDIENMVINTGIDKVAQKQFKKYAHI